MPHETPQDDTPPAELSDAQLVLSVGRALYGEQWQSAMAVAVGTSQSGLRLIALGERNLSPAMKLKLMEFARKARIADEKERVRRKLLLRELWKRWQ